MELCALKWSTSLLFTYFVPYKSYTIVLHPYYGHGKVLGSDPDPVLFGS
jgi:hypothetical protein